MVHLHEPQGLLGSLNFTCSIALLGKAFNLYVATAKVKAPQCFIQITEELEEDLVVCGLVALMPEYVGLRLEFSLALFLVFPLGIFPPVSCSRSSIFYKKYYFGVITMGTHDSFPDSF